MVSYEGCYMVPSMGGESISTMSSLMQILLRVVRSCYSLGYVSFMDMTAHQKVINLLKCILNTQGGWPKVLVLQKSMEIRMPSYTKMC